MEVELYVASIKPKTKYSKSLRLQEVDVSLTKFNKSYEEFLKPTLNYFSGNHSLLATKYLEVLKVMPKGNYIMGIFGGERKKGKKTYAGLVIEEMRQINGGLVEFRLVNMSKKLKDSEKEFKKYLHVLIYGGEVFPFYLNRFYNFLFAKKEEDLKKYLKRLLNLNKNELSDEVKLLEDLINEVKASGEPLTEGNWYVLYRRMRAFASLAFKPDSNIYVIPDEVSAIHVGYGVEAESKAYYYAAVLNYMVYKASKFGIVFARGQFARPLYALVELGLGWSNTDVSVALNNKHVNVRVRVTELSKELHNLAPKTLKNSVKKGVKVSKMFEVLENDGSTAPLLKELTQVIDAYLEKHRGLKEDDVKDILASWVGGVSEELEEGSE